MAMKFSRLGLIVLLGVMGSVFAPLILELSLFSVSPVVAQTNQERKEEADRLSRQGWEYFNAGQFQESKQSFQQALEIYQDIGERRLEALSLMGIILFYASRYQYEEVILYAQQSLTILQEIGERRLIAGLMNDLGNLYSHLGRHKQALDYYQQSLAIFRELENQAGIALSFNSLGSFYESLGQYEQALDYLQRSLAIREEIGDQADIADSFNNLGIVYNDLGQYEKALDYHQRSLAILQETGSPAQVAASLHNLGLVYSDLGQYNKALDYYQRSLAIKREIGNQADIALSLNNLGTVYSNLGQYEKALDYHQRSLAILQETGSPAQVAASLHNLGLVYSDLGQYKKALDYYQRSLAIEREIGNQADIADSLNNLGTVYSNLGQYEKALDYHQRSLTIREGIGNQDSIADSLNNLGLVYSDLGQYNKALDYYQRSLAIKREIGNQADIALSLNNLGSVYLYLGQYKKAIDYYQQSLAIKRKIGNQDSIANSFYGLGLVYNELGQYKKAIDYHQQSLAIREGIGNQNSIADSLNSLGNVYDDLGQHEQALDYLQRSLAIREEIGYQKDIALSLVNLGSVYQSLGQYDQAIDYSQRSLIIFQKIGDKQKIATVLNNLGLYLLLVGNITAAENNFTQAMEVLESLRVGLSDEQKISIFDTQIGTYIGLQFSLNAQNKTNQALEISERGRARALVELLAKRFSFPSQEEQKPQYPQIAEIKQIAKQQNATLVQYSVIVDEIYIWVISPQGKIDFVAVDIPDDNTLKELVEQGKACAVDPNSKEKCRSNEIPDNFVPGDLVRFNDDEKNRLERPWRVTAFNPETGMLTVTHPQFNDTNITVERHKSEVIPLGNNLEVQLKNLQKLHQLLIAPIKQFLPEDENDHVIFVPHQELFGVPFPALQDEQGTYLIKQHTILTAPSIQALQLTNQRRKKLGNKELSQSEFLIIGNPDMPNNPELPGENVKLKPLPHSETEANNIASQFNSQALIGLVATETTVVEKMKTADIIHLATHGLVQDNYTGGSIPGAIALSKDNTNDGLLTADELFQLENQLQARLVVLSACDTGRGAITGDGIIGLSRSLIAAGTPSILVSLWKVPDESTGELMVRFYEHLEDSGNKAQALRQAMLETMEERPFPRDWAAFTLIGEAF